MFVVRRRRGSCDQFVARQIIVGVRHVSATLAVGVWLMMVAICRLISLPSTSPVAALSARKGRIVRASNSWLSPFCAVLIT